IVARRRCRPPSARSARRRGSSPSRCASSARRATGTGATGRRSPSRSTSSCSRSFPATPATTTKRSRRFAGSGSPRPSTSSHTLPSGKSSRARSNIWRKAAMTDSLPCVQVLNFYSTIFADELKRGRKTATIRLGDKSGKSRKNQAVLVTIGFQHSPRERIFEAVIDQVDVMKVADLSPRDIKHDNPEFRRHEELINFLEHIYGRAVSMDDVVTVVRFSQIVDNPSGMTQAMKGFGGAQN